MIQLLALAPKRIAMSAIDAEAFDTSGAEQIDVHAYSTANGQHTDGACALGVHRLKERNPVVPHRVRVRVTLIHLLPIVNGIVEPAAQDEIPKSGVLPKRRLTLHTLNSVALSQYQGPFASRADDFHRKHSLCGRGFLLCVHHQRTLHASTWEAPETLESDRKAAPPSRTVARVNSIAATRMRAG